jgi:hypothetical protein
MSDLETKLSAPSKSRSGKAQATLGQLTARWAYRERYEGNTSSSIMLVNMGGQTEVWKKVSGSGLSAVYELESQS